MSPTIIGVIGIVVLLLVLFSRIPVAFALFLVGFAGFAYLVSPEAARALLFKDLWGTFSRYSLTVVPLFIFMGEIIFHSGISRRLYDTGYTWLGHQSGGIASATIAASAGFAAISGSSLANAGAMATLVMPEMKRFNYDDALATGSIAAGGTLGTLIPPSVNLIIYGILTEVSIGRLFIAGIIPGILRTILFLITIYFMCWRNPLLGPKGPLTSLRDKLSSLTGVIDAIILFILVMGGLFMGLFTPTEAGAIGAAGALVIALARRGLTWQGFRESLMATGEMTAMAFIILFGATVFGHFMTVSRLPYDLATWAGALPVSRYVVLVLMLVIYALGGCFVVNLALLIIIIPIFFPVVIALGFDPIWFGVMTVLVGEMGSVTPPVGVITYVISGISKVRLETVFRGCVPFIIAMLISDGICIAFPQIVMFLPNFMYGR